MPLNVKMNRFEKLYCYLDGDSIKWRLAVFYLLLFCYLKRRFMP